MWLAWMPSPALACGGLVASEEALAATDAMEALFELAPDEVRASYAVRYHGDATDLGWVIPVPGEVVAVEDGDLALFDEVRAQSQPTVVMPRFPGEESESGGCGCGGAANRSLDGGSKGSQGDVTVVDEGFTGTYDYVVIAATDAADLEAWFTDNGWSGIAAEDLAHYVALGSTFAALRVVPDALSEDPAVERMLPPIRIAYQGDELSFPAVMARHSSMPDQRTTLYVLGESRAVITGGWTQEGSGSVSGFAGDDPQALWDGRLASLGEDRAYARTYADFLTTGDDRFLTRFDTIAPTAVHDADVALGFEDSTVPIETEIRILHVPIRRAAGVPLALLLGLGLGRRRARKA